MALIESKDWDVKTALRVARCESNFNSMAHNFNPTSGDDSYGIFQINRYGELAKSRPSPAWLLDPQNNVDYAYQMYRSGGWSQWGCY